MIKFAKNELALIAILAVGSGMLGWAANRLDGLLASVGLVLIMYVLGKLW